MNTIAARAVGLIALLLVGAVDAASLPAGEAAFPLEFVVGEYALVGQQPDSVVAYSGVARIERVGERLQLTRRIGAAEIVAEGRLEVPQPPGEGSVLRFRWHDTLPVVMTCLVSGDLDNYARLTCTLMVAGRSHRQPGIEAMFPVAVWPDDAPRRQSLPAGKRG